MKQRRCIFPDELKLLTDSMYTYTACMGDCHMTEIHKKCKCVPNFYNLTVPGSFPYCGLEHLKCLADKEVSTKSSELPCQCELGCMNTVYEVEKLTEDLASPGESNPNSGVIEVSFVSWPMVRYKREVLFGWVDLLVSFGGIAGLFLGFSLLSGVEIIYYFTMRAFCMVYRDEDELKRLQDEQTKLNKPPLDLSLTPYFLKEPIKQEIKPKNILPIPNIVKVQPYELHYLP